MDDVGDDALQALAGTFRGPTMPARWFLHSVCRRLLALHPAAKACRLLLSFLAEAGKRTRATRRLLDPALVSRMSAAGAGPKIALRVLFTEFRHVLAPAAVHGARPPRTLHFFRCLPEGRPVDLCTVTRRDLISLLATALKCHMGVVCRTLRRIAASPPPQ